MRTVELAVESGIFRDIKTSPDVRVIVRDYDIEGCDSDDPDLKQDDKGKRYRRLIFQEGN